MADQPKEVPAKPKEKKKKKAEGKSSETKQVESQPSEDKPKQAKPSEAQDAKPAEPKSKPTSRKASSAAEGEAKRKASSAAEGETQAKAAPVATAAASLEGESQRKASVATEGESPRRKSSAVDPSVTQEPRTERKPSSTAREPAGTEGEDREEGGGDDTVEPMERKMSMATEAERQRKRDSVSLHSKQDMLKDLDEDKLKELMEAFMLFDMDGDGYINVSDLKQTFVSLGQADVQDEELKKMISEASNPMDFEAFVILLGFRTIALDPEEILVEALSKWDYNNSGLISEDRIKHDLMTWGDKFSQHEVDWALEEAPTHVKKGNIMIDYIRFCKTLCGLRKKTRPPVPEDFMS